MGTFDESLIIRDDAGRFAGRHPAPPATDLTERLEELQTTGAVAATSIRRRQAGTARTFWRDAHATAPIDLRHPAPKIDPAPGGTRYRVRTYRGAGGNVLRMPSVAAINRMADNGTPSFDVPVQAGDSGEHVAGWVRVTRSEHGVWSARAHGMDFERAQYAERQVAWVLGADHPTFAMNEAGTFNDLVAEQERRRGANPVPVRSSAVSEVAYDPGTATLFVTTREAGGQPGTTYAWQAPRDMYERMLTTSAGRVMATELVRRRPRVEAEQCPRCGRFWVVTGGHDHDCPDLEAADPPVRRGDDRALAAALVAAGHRGPHQDLVEALSDHVVAPPVARFSTIKVDPSRLGGATRFKNLTGEASSRVVRSLGDQAYHRFPAPAEVLAASEHDERVQVAGRVDHDGVTIEEITWEYDGASDPSEAWEALKAAHPLPTADGYDVGRRDRQGRWRFFFASTALVRKSNHERL